MALEKLNYTELIRFNSNGIEIATFTQIRGALTDKFKEIYGSDIDVSTASADGQYVQAVSLMINNILQTVKSMYDALNPATANGKFLDIIASLTNVTRKEATYSTASILVKNIGTDNIVTDTIEFFDQNGTIWTWSSNNTITFIPNESVALTVVCNELGPVEAPIGWINSTVELLNLEVTQQERAFVGNTLETDSELRARRNDSLAIRGVTVLESITSSLLAIAGINDVYIYNNIYDANFNADDGTSIPLHACYICIRQQGGVDVTDEEIGTIIYEKMTPGIHSTECNDLTTGNAKSYLYDTGTSIIQNVYWKQCKPVNPTIVITLFAQTYFASDNTPQIVGQSVIQYLNNLKISTDLRDIDVIIQAIGADPKFRGLSTYTVQSATIAGGSEYLNKDTYYEYSNVQSTITTNAGQKVVTITLS